MHNTGHHYISNNHSDIVWLHDETPPTPSPTPPPPTEVTPTPSPPTPPHPVEFTVDPYERRLRKAMAQLDTGKSVSFTHTPHTHTHPTHAHTPHTPHTHTPTHRLATLQWRSCLELVPHKLGSGEGWREIDFRHTC